MSYAKAWSYSALKDYETCPYRIRLKAEGAPVPTEDPAAANRGTQIHLAAEEYVKGIRDTVAKELLKFEEQLNDDRALYTEGLMSCEDEWGFNRDWEICDWSNAWLRVKCDQFVALEADSARVVDWKSGKSFGNEVPHMQQAQLYALAAFLRYPVLQFVQTDFRYVDENKTKRRDFNRSSDFDRLIRNFAQRAGKMMVDDQCRPKPSRVSCKWCRYGSSKGSGACGWAIGD